MDLFTQRLDARGGDLSSMGRRVAHYIGDNRATVLGSSAKQLAAQIGTSDATVIRTVQALGFTGLGALKQSLVASVDRLATLAETMRRTLDEIGADAARAVEMVFEAHEEALRSLHEPASRAQRLAAVNTLHPAERIAVFGIGPSAALAGYVATLLARAGRRSLLLNASGAMLADQLLDLRPGDALLVLAYGRAYGEVVAVLGEAKRLCLPIVLVTDSLDPNLARAAHTVLAARRGRAGRVALHGATLVCLESVVLGLAAAAQTEAVGTLERLHRLRKTIRGD